MQWIMNNVSKPLWNVAPYGNKLPCLFVAKILDGKKLFPEDIQFLLNCTKEFQPPEDFLVLLGCLYLQTTTICQRNCRDLILLKFTSSYFCRNPECHRLDNCINCSIFLLFGKRQSRSWYQNYSDPLDPLENSVFTDKTDTTRTQTAH